ncbi:MAG: hemerythrin domain-containing protein [Planctomycetes bacterium]|nr:hemerythrin domain-containing protein [Planctomycetota bacterium]
MSVKSYGIRQMILSEHDELRRRAQEIETALERMERIRRASAGELEGLLTAFYARFWHHIENEDKLLRPVLTEDGKKAIVDRMDKEHVDQRARIEALSKLLLHTTPHEHVAKLRAFFDELRKEMHEEEDLCLKPEVPHDDPMRFDSCCGR